MLCFYLLQRGRGFTGGDTSLVRRGRPLGGVRDPSGTCSRKGRELASLTGRAPLQYLYFRNLKSF